LEDGQIARLLAGFTGMAFQPNEVENGIKQRSEPSSLIPSTSAGFVSMAMSTRASTFRSSRLLHGKKPSGFDKRAPAPRAADAVGRRREAFFSSAVFCGAGGG